MSKADIKIRLAVDSDFETIFSIWLDGISNSFDSHKASEDGIKSKFLSNFKSREGIFNFWVAEDIDNNILGWQSLIKASNNPFKANTYAESSTYISKTNRLKGVGKALLEFVMIEAEKSNLEYVIGFISLENEGAKKITQETGWIIVGEIPASKKGNNNIKKSFLVRPV